MENKNIKRIIFSFIFIMLMISFVVFVNAIAIKGAYSQSYPLKMSPGEERVISFSLQNRAGDGDVKFKGEVVDGSEIINFKGDNEYFVEGSPDSDS